MRIKLLFFVFCIAFISCSEQNNNHEISTHQEPIEIDMSSKGSNKKSIFNDMIVMTNIVQLEGKEGSYIKVASKVRMLNNRIYVFDEIQDKVFIFDSDGAFINQFLVKGNGPGEVTDAIDFDIDVDNAKLLVLALNKRQINVYDLIGKFQYSVNNDFQSFQFACLDSEKFGFFIGYFDKSYHNLHITTNNGKPRKMLFPFPKDIRPRGFQLSGFITRNLDGILYSDACSNEIYQIDKNGDSYLKYKLSFGDRTWPENRKFDHFAFSSKTGNFEIDYLNSNYLENREALIIPYQIVNRLEKAIYLKSNSTLYHINDNLLKDLFYTIVSNPKGLNQNGEFISTLDPLLVKDRLAEDMKKGKTIHLNKELASVILNVNNDESNLIVFTYTFNEPSK